MEVVFENPVRLLVGGIHTRTERVPFSEKHHVQTNHFEHHKIDVVIH